MPIYRKVDGKFKKLKFVPFDKEKTLQIIVEENLQEMLDMYFLETEYPTTNARRIDTLAVDYSGAPVIIEFKLNKNENVINQSLSYLKWLKAQKVDFFEMLVLKKLGKEKADSLKIDWKNPRVICIAESYNKFDLDTLDFVSTSIELFTYRYYENDIFLLEPLNIVDSKPQISITSTTSGTIFTEPGATVTEEPTLEALTINIPPATVLLFNALQQRISAIDEAIQEKVTRYYVAYRMSKNFAEVIIAKQHIKIHMRPVEYEDPKNMVDKIPDGYNWTLNKRVYLKSEDDLDYVMGLLEQSYNDVL